MFSKTRVELNTSVQSVILLSERERKGEWELITKGQSFYGHSNSMGFEQVLIPVQRDGGIRLVQKACEVLLLIAHYQCEHVQH